MSVIHASGAAGKASPVVVRIAGPLREAQVPRSLLQDSRVCHAAVRLFGLIWTHVTKLERFGIATLRGLGDLIGVGHEGHVRRLLKQLKAAKVLEYEPYKDGWGGTAGLEIRITPAHGSFAKIARELLEMRITLDAEGRVVSDAAVRLYGLIKAVLSRGRGRVFVQTQQVADLLGIRSKRHAWRLLTQLRDAHGLDPGFIDFELALDQWGTIHGLWLEIPEEQSRPGRACPSGDVRQEAGKRPGLRNKRTGGVCALRQPLSSLKREGEERDVTLRHDHAASLPPDPETPATADPGPPPAPEPPRPLSVEEAIAALAGDPDPARADWLAHEIAQQVGDPGSLGYYRKRVGEVAAGAQPPERLLAAYRFGLDSAKVPSIQRPGGRFHSRWQTWRPTLTEAEARARREAEARAKRPGQPAAPPAETAEERRAIEADEREASRMARELLARGREEAAGPREATAARADESRPRAKHLGALEQALDWLAGVDDVLAGEAARRIRGAWARGCDAERARIRARRAAWARSDAAEHRRAAERLDELLGGFA